MKRSIVKSSLALLLILPSLAGAASPSDLANLFGNYKGEVGNFDATAAGSAVTADAAAIARWEDQSGNGRHLIQATAGNRCVYDAVKGLVVSQMPNDNWFTCPASYTLDRQNFSIFYVVELSNLRKTMNGATVANFHFFTGSTLDAMNLHMQGDGASATAFKLAGYDGTFKASTSIPITTQRCLIGFVGTSGGLKCYVDGTYTTATALLSGNATLTSLLGYGGGSIFPSQAAYRDVIVYSRALSDAEVTNTIWPYAQTRGVAASRKHQVIFEGDSITHGYGTVVNRNWPSKLGLAATIRHRVTAESGITLAILSSQAAARIDPLFVAGETNVLCIFAGTNDIGGVATGTDTYNALVSYCQARRTAGYKIVAFTMLPRGTFNATQNGYRATFNSSILANSATFADAVVDVTSDARLTDSSNLTYFNADTTHLTDAGQAVVASLALPKIQSLLPANAPGKISTGVGTGISMNDADAAGRVGFGKVPNRAN